MTSRDETRTDHADVANLHASARVGTIVAKKWHLDALLGAGGMAVVYAATHRNGSRAALKILHLALATDRAIRSRFQREGYAANAVGHPGAVRVLDDDLLEDGSPFLVTELLDGETLEQRRERLGGRLSAAEVLTYSDALLDVLAAAHSKGVVHRDLKPDNLFLTRAGQLKVLDFGIARLRDLASDSQLTKNGALLGTPRYMSPEQARGLTDEVDAQSDLWSCGATMFELLSGRPVFDAPTPHQVLMLAATIPAPAFESVCPDAPRSVASLIDRALAFEKKDRWPDAATMQQAVRVAYCDRRGDGVSTALRGSWPATDARHRGSGAGAAGDETVAEGVPARGSANEAPPEYREPRPELLDRVRRPVPAAPARNARKSALDGAPSAGARAPARIPGRRQPLVPAVPSLRSTLSDGISDQTLTPTNPEPDKRPTDRPVVAAVASAPPPAQRLQVALPAFVLGAGIAGAIALLVRSGVSPEAQTVVVAAPRSTTEERSPASGPTALARAAAAVEGSSAEPARRATPSETETTKARVEPPAGTRNEMHAAVARVAPEAGASGAPISGAAPLPTTIRRNCMRLDDPGIDGGNTSRVVCL